MVATSVKRTARLHQIVTQSADLEINEHHWSHNGQEDETPIGFRDWGCIPSSKGLLITSSL